MRVLKTITVSGVLLLSACGGNQSMDKDVTGWIGGGVGALLGGWAGSQFGGGTGELIFTGLGAVIGGSAGYEAGRSLGAADHAIYKNTIKGTLNDPAGQSTWKNDDTGTSGYVSTAQTFKDGNGRLCRGFRSTVAFDDGVVSGNGAACKDSTGDWVLVADAFR